MAITICHQRQSGKWTKKLQEQYVIEPVKFFEWAAPIIPVLKHDRKNIRICRDYKLTANKATKVDQYPIPKIDNLLSNLAGGFTFTHLNMSKAYQQLELDDQSEEIVKINTHTKGFLFITDCLLVSHLHQA